MNFKEAKLIARKWLEALEIPADLKGVQVNTLSYLHDEKDPVLLASKKELLSRLLKRRGARIIHEADSWSLAESRNVVDEYMSVLVADLKGHATIARQLKEKLMLCLGKSEKAVRFKLRHISSVLVNSDQPYLKSLKPLGRANIDLVDWNETEVLKCLIEKWLARDDFLTVLVQHASQEIKFTHAAEKIRAEPESPPETDCYDDPSRPRRLLRVPVRINYAEREAANRSLGTAGEEWVFNHERSRLESLGYPDLAARVRWVSRDDGDGLGYDIASFNMDGSPRWIEVKTTRQGKYAAFYISAGEVAFARENTEKFYIYRVFNFGDATGLFILSGVVESHVRLTPTSYRAVFLAKSNADE
jgi:hypothetical protein